MSAKHKRPFLVFAAVAAICCMVLVTGVRSKADGTRTPDVFSATVATAGPPISPVPEPTVTSTPDSGPETDPDAGHEANDPTSAPGEWKNPRSDPGSNGGDRVAVPDSGLIVVPPSVPRAPEPADVDPGGVEVSPPSVGDPGKSAKRKHRGKPGIDGKHGDKPGGKSDEKDEHGDKVAVRHGYPTQPLSTEDLDNPPAVEGGDAP